MRNSKITAIVLSAIIGIGVGTGGTLVYENNQEAKQISKLEQTTKANAVEEIVKGNVLATLWQQNSGEVKALRYEAYNSGKRYVDELVKEPTAKPYAVTLDIDETIIDNSPHAGYEIKHNELFSKENFGEWVQMADAAAIDGATAWEKMWNVTIPSIKGTILFALVMLTIGGFNVFTSVKMITGGEPGHQTDVILTWMYHKAFSTGKFGYAAALSFITTVVLALLAVVQFKLMQQKDQ